MTVQKKAKDDVACFYQDSYAHLSDELRKLDLLLQLRVITFRQKTLAIQEKVVQSPMYITHAEIDSLLGHDEFLETAPPEFADVRNRLAMFQSEIDAKTKASIEQGIFLALPQLAHIFALSSFESQVVIICLAPELCRKYDKLYAYLQDDITRKKPSVDLVLDLLCETQTARWQVRAYFTEAAPLFHAKILQMNDDPQSPSGSSDLARFLKLDHRILNYLLGNNNIDGRLLGLAKLYRPALVMDQILVDPTTKMKICHFTQHYFSAKGQERKKLVLYLHGPYGAGKRELALGICQQLNCFLLYVDLELLLAKDSEAETLLRLVFRESLLLQAAVYLDHVEAFQNEESTKRPFLKALAAVMAEYGWLTFLAGEKPWLPRGVFEQMAFHAVELPVPAVPVRLAAWENALANLNGGVEAGYAATLSRQFRLTPGQVNDAIAFVENQCATRDGERQITLADIYAACRQQSNQKLRELAIKIEPRYGWEDIILPVEKLTQLKEICNQVKHHYRVFGEWGFDQKLSHGKGLSVLFSGLPGTGKTMAAEVIAHELQLDLYKIDLSGVVSKYIGETEKNLAKIFHEAETSNAILFFDEADALFGKRTKISDAHDRYANVETSYLLQKMEEYEGVVILATNLRENMDEAFTRRIRFIVEFPFPDEANRLQIWKKHFPNQAPVSVAIDYEFLAKQFQIAGGNIKNIVLNSAFLAAADGGDIGMEHLLRGTKRELEKMGRLWDEKNLYKLTNLRV